MVEAVVLGTQINLRDSALTRMMATLSRGV